MENQEQQGNAAAPVANTNGNAPSRTWIISAVIGAILVLFAFQNAETVNVGVLFWHFERSLALVLVATLVLGVLLALIALLPGKWKRDGELKSYKERVDKLEEALQNEQLKWKQKQLEDDLNGVSASDKSTNSTTSDI